MINLITFLIIVFLVASVFGNHNPRHRSYPRYYHYRNYHEGSPYPDDYYMIMGILLLNVQTATTRRIEVRFCLI